MTTCDLVHLTRNAAPVPCEIPGCGFAQATTFALYCVGSGWVNAGRYRCEDHR
jgi:hypothetical protein